MLYSCTHTATVGVKGLTKSPARNIYDVCYTACLSFTASEIAADEIAAKNQPPKQRAENLNRRLAFRRLKFTPPRKLP